MNRRGALVHESGLGGMAAAIDVMSAGFSDQFAQQIARAETRAFTNSGHHGRGLRSLVRASGRPVQAAVSRTRDKRPARRQGAESECEFFCTVQPTAAATVNGAVLAGHLHGVAT